MPYLINSTTLIQGKSTVKKFITVLTILFVSSVLHSSAGEKAQTHFSLWGRAKNLVLPRMFDDFKRDFLGEKNDSSVREKLDFTYFNNVKDIKYSRKDQALTFIMAKSGATLGWGNYNNRQAKEKRYRIWPRVQIRILARQKGCKRSKWKVRPYWEGKYQYIKSAKRKRHYKIKESAVLKGSDWYWLEFTVMSGQEGGGRERSPLDAFSIDINAVAGAEIEIKEFQFGRYYFQGVFRKEFKLPEGKIWRAAADAGNETVLYINGKEVTQDKLTRPRPVPGDKTWDKYLTEKIDIGKYLKPGRNCIVLKGASGASPPNIYFQGTAVMTDGKVIVLDSDETWHWTPCPPQDGKWLKAGYDDSQWNIPVVSNKNPVYMIIPEKNAEAVIWWRSHLKPSSDRPAYNGRLIIQNPNEPQLFYYAGKPVNMTILSPKGVAAESPCIIWSMDRYADGKTRRCASGKLTDFKKEKDSIVFPLNAGTLPAGVYLVNLSMFASDGSIMEKRIPEPFVVAGKIKMREVAGNSYEDGMDLELEHDIDFVNPGPDYPTADTDGRGSKRNQPVRKSNKSALPPLIVKKNGLKYRTTRPAWKSEFSCLVKNFRHPGSFYLGVLEYPEDEKRAIGLSLVSEMMLNENNSCDLQKLGIVALVDDKFPLSGKTRTMKFLFRPDPGVHAFNIISTMDNNEAAAVSLKLYYIKNGLPALKLPGGNRRLIGYLTESWNTSQRENWSNWYSAFKYNKTRLYAKEWWFARKNTRPELAMCKYLEKWLDAANHYVEYLKFTGQNFHVMSMYMYNEKCNPFIDNGEFRSSRLNHDMREICARIFNANGIDFVSSIEYGGSIAIEKKLDEKADTSWYIFDKKGHCLKQGLWGLNWNHPKVMEHMLKVTRRVTRKFNHLPNFKGLNWTTFMMGEFQPSWRHYSPEYNADDRLSVGYGDVTVSLFEKETGVKLPKFNPGNSDRFRLRYNLLTSPEYRNAWIKWREGRTTKFFTEVLTEMKKQRRDLILLITPLFHTGLLCEYTYSGMPFAEFVRECGWNYKTLNRLLGVGVTQNATATDRYWNYRKQGNTHRHRFSQKKYPYAWLMNTDEEIFENYAGEDVRSILVQHHWIEKHMLSWQLPSESPSGDVWPRSYCRYEGHRGGDIAAEVYTQSMIGGDPNTIMFGFSDGGYLLGDEQHLRDLCKVYRCIPREKFIRWKHTGFRTNLAIRKLRKNNKLWFYAANPVFWEVKGEMKISGANSVRDVVTGKEFKPDSEGMISIPVSLKPYGIAGFTASGGKAEIVSFSTGKIPPYALKFITDMTKRVKAMLTRDELTEAILPKDVEFMKKSVKSAEIFLDKGEYAAVWSILTNSRFWNLREQYLEGQEKLLKHATVDTAGVSTDTSKRQMEVHFAKFPPVIDGKLNDTVWKNAKPQSGFMETDGAPARADTKVMAAYDKNNIYFAFICADRFPDKVKGSPRTGEKQLLSSGQDIIDIMLQPDVNDPSYYQLGFNFGGAKFDQEIIRGGRNGGFKLNWQTGAVKTRNGWTAEVKIPVAGVKGHVGSGKTWGANFFRMYRGKILPDSMWCWQGKQGWHAPEKFGRLNLK